MIIKKFWIISLLLVTAMLLTLSMGGCSFISMPIETTTSDTQADPADSETDDIADETTAEAETEEKEGFSEDASASLTSFRQGMIGTTEMFAIAYLGYTDESQETDVVKWLAQKYPQLCSDLPFIGEIPDGNIVGGTMGDVYCIVPLDEESTVAINSSVESEDGRISYENVIYRSEKGDPVIVVCNGSGFSPDTEVNIMNNSGNSVTWYPNLSDSARAELDNGSCSDAVVNDFSPYSEMLWNEYKEMQESFWELPEASQLAGTTWSAEQFMENGEVHTFDIIFNEDTADVYWNNDGEDHEYEGAPWYITFEGGVATMVFDFGGLAGDVRCSVLISMEGEMLYTCADLIYGDDDLCGSGVFARILEKTVG